MKTMNIVIIVGLVLFLILYLIYNPFILEGLATDESIIANIETQISKIPQQTTDPKIIGQKLSLHKQLLEKLNKILSDPKFSDSKINDPKTPKTEKDDKANYEARRSAVTATVKTVEAEMTAATAALTASRKAAAGKR
jgi:hypothetical protein